MYSLFYNKKTDGRNKKMKKMLFIYNPNAGTGLLKPKLSDVLDIFVKGGYEVTVYPTQRYHDALAKMESYEEEYDLVACSGGDGTLDEIVTGMAFREKRFLSAIFRQEQPMILLTVFISHEIYWKQQIQ